MCTSVVYLCRESPKGKCVLGKICQGTKFEVDGYHDLGGEKFGGGGFGFLGVWWGGLGPLPLHSEAEKSRSSQSWLW